MQQRWLMLQVLVFTIHSFHRSACLQATKAARHNSIYPKSNDLDGFGPTILMLVCSLLLQQLCDETCGRRCVSPLSMLASCLAEGASLPHVCYLSPQDLKGTPRRLCLGLCILKVCPWKTLSFCDTWASVGSVLLRKASNSYSSQNAA